jgi:hypothetical protein
MDVTSTVVSLLGAAIDGFNHIQLAREFETDFAMHQLKLDVLQLRLSRWGQVAGISADRTSIQKYLDAPEDTTAKDGHKNKIQVILEAIEETLDRAQRQAGKEDHSFDVKNREILDPELHVPNGMKRIRQRLRASLRKREIQFMKVAGSVKWAFYKKEKFESFVAAISSLITNLEDLFPEDQKQQLRDLSNEECKDMSRPNLEDLNEIAEDCDPWLKDAVEEKLKNASDGSGTYVNVSAPHNAGNVAGIHHGNNSTTTNNNYGGTPY